VRKAITFVFAFAMLTWGGYLLLAGLASPTLLVDPIAMHWPLAVGGVMAFVGGAVLWENFLQ
jgi:TRAP-type C4-dicarboxylate transport system permease small subunit